MKKKHFKKYIAPYASSDHQFRRDPNFQIFLFEMNGEFQRDTVPIVTSIVKDERKFDRQI